MTTTSRPRSRAATPAAPEPAPPPTPEPETEPETAAAAEPAAALLEPPPPPTALPVVPIATPASTPVDPHAGSRGYFDAHTGERVNLADVFRPVPGMATMVESTRRVIERHRVPGTTDATTETLVTFRGARMSAAQAAALVARLHTASAGRDR